MGKDAPAFSLLLSSSFHRFLFSFGLSLARSLSFVARRFPGHGRARKTLQLLYPRGLRHCVHATAVLAEDRDLLRSLSVPNALEVEKDTFVERAENFVGVGGKAMNVETAFKSAIGSFVQLWGICLGVAV